MKRFYKFLLCITLTVAAFLKTQYGHAQTDEPAVKMQARATDRSIKLRWAPNTPATWELANKYGYTVERIKLTENGKTVTPERVKLTSQPIKPFPQSAWEPSIDQDDYVAVAAQAIYGETFEITENDHGDIMKVINKAKELESRYSFALFSADQSLKAAELSGLYLEDQTIAPGTRYLYRVYVNIPTEILKVDTASVFLGLEDFQPLPKPLDLKANFQDHTVMLSWNGSLLERMYNSFWVERSDDGGRTFKKITEQPIVNAFNGENPRSKLIYKTDTLVSNDVTYFYRVRGNNAFGETGPPSDVVSGSGKPIFGYSATIVKHEVTSEGKAKLEWSFPAEGEYLLKSFDLIRVNQATKVQTEIKTNIDGKDRTIIDEKPLTTNYYVIRSVDRYGRKNNSFPYLVQTEDSIPPSSPIELTGRIDTLGRVYLNWKANEEEDLYGYHIFRANFASEEFIQKPGPILTENRYVDTVKLTTLTEKIYYKVVAVDNRFNPSEFSKTIILEKPDKIPPVPADFKSIKSDSSGIVVRFNFSSSSDVLEHLLYRRGEDEDEWTLVKSYHLGDTVGMFRDNFVRHKTNYSYTLVAVDDDGLESLPSVPVDVTFISNTPYPEVEQIYYSLDQSKKTLILSWNYAEESIEKFLIYKSINGQPLTLYKSVGADVKELKDFFSANDSKIEYRIIAGFRSGERTMSSKPLIVKM